MNAKETTTNRTFVLEVNNDEMDILMSLVGCCSPSALGQDYDGPAGKLLYRMYDELERVAGTQGEVPKYRLAITKSN